MKSKYFIIPIFVPHLGCPHDCVFCNQKRIAGVSTDVTKSEVKKIIDDHLATFPEGNHTIEVAFFGGSFTAIDMDIQRELLSIPYDYKKRGQIDYIRMSTRPDAIDHEVLKMLVDYSVDTIELGVQSLDNKVLFDSGRGHDSQAVYRACELIQSYGINLGLQMMLGLVGDSREKSLYTAREIIKLDPYCVRIYPTLVIKDTYLEKLYLDGSYKALELDEAVDLTRDILMLFDYEDIDVIRVGLQPTENIQLGRDVIAGPFHPSFRQLVESSIIREVLLQKFEEYGIRNLDQLTIRVGHKEISNLVGQKAVNTKYLKEKYSIGKIRVEGQELDENLIVLSYLEKELLVDLDQEREIYLKKKKLL